LCAVSLLAVLLVAACSNSADDAPPTDGDAEIEPDDDSELLDEDGDAAEEDGEEEIADRDDDSEAEWEFDRDDYTIINGWILLDSDPEAVRATIETAADYGVNHVQLSHDLIMNIEDILGDGSEVLQRIETLNMGIALAHDYGMKAFIWAHEFSAAGPGVCYAPDDPVWEARSQAYRDGLARIPDVDGVVLMFGSAPNPPWFTICTCDWCAENYDLPAWESPPNEERIRILTEKVGGTIVNELGKTMLVRTFVHEPAEIGWHSQGLAAVQGVEFAGMHKGPVQDWQPYHPHDPCGGAIGPHPSVLEDDVAGEYYGLSTLPFCSPGYFRYRLKHLWDRNGIGAVIRVQRGSEHALGTPNEVNVYAISELLKDIHKPLESIWDEFIASFYGLNPGDEGQTIIEQVLKLTFPIRLKSHYVLGIWALEKGSDLPDGVVLDQFYDRGEMPKWDPDWQSIWDALDKPDRQTVIAVWQEGTEAVELAEQSLADAEPLADSLAPEQWTDLLRRLKHQKYAAEAWRAVKLFIWATRAAPLHADDPLPPAWAAWAHRELGAIRQAMIDDGLADASPAGPSRIAQFLSSTTPPAGATAAMPDPLKISPLALEQPASDRVVVRFRIDREARVTIDYGLEIPDYGQTVEAGVVPAGVEQTVELADLEPGKRYVCRARVELDGLTYLGGDYWIFTPEAGDEAAK